MSVAPASTARVASHAASGSSVIDQAGAELLPAADTLWHDVYHVTVALPSVGAAQLWKANRTDTAEEVLLRVTPDAKDEARSAAWKRLCTLELAHLQRARETLFIGTHRVEVYDAVRGTPLDVWRRGRESVELATIEIVVRQIMEALGVLHASGLVHLGLRPGVVFVREDQGALQCTLGGLETVTLFDHHKPIPALADPFYAPPEAAALDTHEPGPTLCAWDWWSLGRIAQELFLGHPVLDDLPGADRTETASARFARAEAQLLEHATKGLRAGGVEVMLGLDPRLKLLLRGLLASAPETRWGGDVVDRWVRQMPVKEHYDTPRTEKKFRWRRRLYSVAEAAKELQTAEGWSEAVPQIFGAATPGSLANFIIKSPEQKNVAPQLAELLKLAESEPLLSLSPAWAREVLATVALVMLSGGNLVWRGRRLDGESLAAVLAEEADDAERFAFVRALTHRTITAQIERHDFGASRSLAQVGRSAADAEAIIRRNGWLKGTDEAATAKIFRLTLESDAVLLGIRDRMRHDFACSNQPAIEKIFKVAKPAHVELVVLAWVEPIAAQSGFVTHPDWEAQQLKLHQERSGPIVVGLLWAQLQRALAAGPAVFGPWPAVVTGWLAAAMVVAYVWPGPKWLLAAMAPALLAIGARAAAGWLPAAAVRRFAPAARAWRWRDGASRCAAEVAVAGNGLDADGFRRALAEINSEIAKLKLLNPPPTPIAAPPPFGALRRVGLASWIVVSVIVAGCGWRCVVHSPSWSGFQVAWNPAMALPVPTTPEAKAAAVKFGQKEAAAEREIAARAGQDVKVSWPYHENDDFETLNVLETLEPTKGQTAYALKRGQAIGAPYRKETINSLVVFEVPAGDKFGVMIYDGSKEALAAPRVFILPLRPPAREWVEIAGKKAVVVPE